MKHSLKSGVCVCVCVDWMNKKWKEEYELMNENVETEISERRGCCLMCSAVPTTK